MGVLLQGFFKMPPNQAVPSPADGDAMIDWWWDHLARQANEIRQAGFTAIWLPPVLKTSAGDKPGSDGYGPFDDYDMGSKNQKGSVSTRFGNREQLQRCVAVMRANGLDVYLDMVEHHRDGDTTPFVFRYLGANGTPDVGRFPKNPSNFLPQVPRDPALGGAPKDDAPFGRELAPINAKPTHYVFDNLIAASDWLTRALDVQGYRLDDVKGLSTEFLFPFLTSKSMRGKFAVGEFFDGNRVLVNGWIFNPNGMKGRPSAFDFPMKFVLNAMCNNPGGFNMADLDHVGLAGISPMNAVTFVENHDTDLNDGKIVINKILGYAYILTSEGYPCVYYRDYSTGKNCFGLKPLIDNLIWIHEKLASGATQQRWKDFNVFAYERLGGPRLLVGLNNDPNNARTITVATEFGPNVPLHDYTGHSPDVTTDGNGSVTIGIPKNQNGRGYVCYSRQGQGGASFDVAPRAVTQDFEGANDLDIPPATNGKAINVARIWSRANSPLSLLLQPDVTGWTPNTTLALDVVAPDASVLASSAFKLDTPVGTALNTNSKEAGFHTLRLTLAGAPPAKPNSPFSLSATYTSESIFNPPKSDSINAAAQAEDPAKFGQWSAKIALANVPIHTHILPTGKVLFWGRRNTPGATDFPSLNQHETHAFLWDPEHPLVAAKPTSNQPTDSHGNAINLFCSGHTFLQDGRLLVTGGHIFDSQGLNTSTFYDPFTDKWTAGPTMNNGRWYPTAVTLPDGRAFVCSGSFPVGVPQPPPHNANVINNIPQVLEDGNWNDLTNFTALPLFPRFHVAPDGSLFMSGANATTYLFENLAPGNHGTWVPIATRTMQNADYAPSVMYDVGKVVFIGGGSTTNVVETIDLNAAKPAWAVAAPMKFRRRQHNATLLPDGTVLVTGGSQGTEFNGLNPGEPIHTPELWDPAKGTWTEMALEAVDRCYHSTAVLLPDGRVFSGGGGEYAPNTALPIANPTKDTHADAQLFSPPYLFNGARPAITKAPATVTFGEAFDVETPAPNDISEITWIRLPSVTHSFDQNQRINFLTFQRSANKVTVNAPPNGNVCPPGHYMLFLLNQKKVPSVAAIVQITAAAAAPAVRAAVAEVAAAPAALASPLKLFVQKNPLEQDAEIQAREKIPPIVVGVTPTCPYGISACWGGAYEALTRMNGVRLVRPVPNAQDSTAFVYLKHGGLPDLDAWSEQFAHVANGTHFFRGVEVTLDDVLQTREADTLVMQGNDVRPPVLLQPIEAADKIQWDVAKGSQQALDPHEADAYQRLQEKVKNAGGSWKASVTGPLKTSDNGYVLEVRRFN